MLLEFVMLLGYRGDGVIFFSFLHTMGLIQKPIEVNKGCLNSQIAEVFQWTLVEHAQCMSSHCPTHDLMSGLSGFQELCLREALQDY